MSAESIIYLLVLLVPIVSLDLPKVDVSSLAGARSYEMTVECPEGCLESVVFELNCSTGTLSRGRTWTTPEDWVETIEYKVEALERLVGLVSSSWSDDGSSAIESRIVELEEKVDKVIQCLSGH